MLALAPNTWNGPWMNRQQLLSRLGRRHVILYSSGPTLREQTLPDSSRIRWNPRLVSQDNVTVDLLPKWMAYTQRRPLLGALTMRLLTRRWRRYLDSPGGGPLVGWFFHPRYWPYVTYLKPDRLVYHAYDLYHLQGRWDATRADQERQFAQRADLVVASSPQIAGYLSQLGAQSPVVIENAVDYSDFAIDTSRTSEPADLQPVPHPRLGYTGALNRKVDFPLLAWLAGRHPEWHVVLIGKLGNLDVETRRALDQLGGLPNVHLLGFKPHHELPEYVARMDVNLLAYRLTPGVWTEGIYPLKLHEYLAVGRPVVSADLPAVRAFGKVIHIVQQSEDWEAAIAASLRDTGTDAEERRRAVARANDWDARVEVLDQIMVRRL